MRVNGLNKAFIALIKTLNAAIMQARQMLYQRLNYLRLVTARALMTSELLFCFGFFVSSSRGNFVFGFWLATR